MAARTAARPLTYGFDGGADVRAEDVESAGFDGMRFTLHATAGGRAIRQPVAIPGLGRLSVHNALAGAAVGLATGIDPGAVAAGLARGWSAPHRGAVRQAGEVRFVDDSYNASPGSVTAALDLLAGLPGRRVAVLGEMLELGGDTEAGHATVGQAAAATVDLLVVVGDGAAGIAQGALDAGLDASRVLRVVDRDAALDALRSRLRPGDVVLVKASRGIALNLLVDDLVAELGGSGAPGAPGERPR
jgi:UDP-N-acetylmuramoyl-tripeptide--D-alanyl-D-alanine ligase